MVNHYLSLKVEKFLLPCLDLISSPSITVLFSHIITYPIKELCSTMALEEVGVSLLWWCHPFVLLAPGYWRPFLNLILLFQNWKSKIREVSILLLKVSTSTEHKKQKKGHHFGKRLETLWILDFQFWNNNTKFRKSLQ